MSYKTTATNDIMIRSVLKGILEKRHSKDKKVRIIEELGVQNGNARIDIAIVNGILHGYEIKSDLDTLRRLQEQITIFNSVFDKMTIVVGKSHLYEAIRIVPEWWGITVAKVDTNGSVVFYVIRKEEINKDQDKISVAKLLWRAEALKILDEIDEVKGLRSKSKNFIYQKLSNVFDQKTLGEKVRETLFFRADWRPDAPLIQNGD